MGDTTSASPTFPGIPPPLEQLLPPREDSDTLVAFYLNDLAQLHRVIHIPTFKQEYAKFWDSGQPRHSAMAALILSMSAISACTSGSSSDTTSAASRYRTMPGPWILACENWVAEQSFKHRKLVHYQVSCLLYLAKRVNMIGKKRFWMETGSLLQSAIVDGLHCDPSSTTNSPYMQEMKRRMWMVLRELHLQTTLEYGLPALLHNIDSTVAAPANIDDDEFDESTIKTPNSRPTSQYTQTSYQSLSARSWDLRLEISRHLYNPGLAQPLNYDDVLRYTQSIAQAIHALPTWDSKSGSSDHMSRHSILTNAFLKFQLMECTLAMHRPYLQRDDSRFWLSENVCHQTSRDMLFLNIKLADSGVDNLTNFREDLLLASLSLTRITMLQPKGTFGPQGLSLLLYFPVCFAPFILIHFVDSTSIIMSSARSTIDLLEKCVPSMEERYLRCSHAEPWCFITMCAIVMLLKVHLGEQSYQTAKFSCAQRFLNSYYKHVGRQQPLPSGQQQQLPATSNASLDHHEEVSVCTASICNLIFPASHIERRLTVTSSSFKVKTEADFVDFRLLSPANSCLHPPPPSRLRNGWTAIDLM